jgi:hypothetical protein
MDGCSTCVRPNVAFTPEAGRVSLWVFDWRRVRDSDTQEGPVFFVAREHVTVDGVRLGIWNIWCMFGEEESPVCEMFDDLAFVRQAITEGRLQRIGPLPRLPDDSPHHELFTVPPPWDELQ